jgi:hypothetical protein
MSEEHLYATLINSSPAANTNDKKRVNDTTSEVEACPSKRRSALKADTEEVTDPTQQLKDTLVKLQIFLNKDSKFPKASVLMSDLILQRMDKTNVTDFMNVIIGTIMLKHDKLRDKHIVSSCIRLLDAVHEKEMFLSNVLLFRLDSCKMVILHRINLHTDDSYDFIKYSKMTNTEILAIPTLMEVISALNCPSSDVVEEIYKERLQALIWCVETTCKLYQTQSWAKQPVEKLCGDISTMRLQFPPLLRDSLDELTTIITQVQRKNISSRGIQTIRTLNSIAHPLRSSKNDILK